MILYQTEQVFPLFLHSRYYCLPTADRKDIETMPVIHPKDIVKGRPARPKNYPPPERFSNPNGPQFVSSSKDFRTVPGGKTRKWESAVPNVSKTPTFMADYSLDVDEVKARILMLTRLRSELLTRVLVEEEKKYVGKKQWFEARIFSPNEDYNLVKIPALAGNGLQPASLYQVVCLCNNFFPKGDFKTAVPLFTRVGERGIEVLAFHSETEGREWAFGFHPAKVSGKFSKDLRL